MSRRGALRAARGCCRRFSVVFTLGARIATVKSHDPMDAKTPISPPQKLSVFFQRLFFDRNHFVPQLTKHFAMNTLTTKIKISVLFSLIAAGLTLAGCASRSAKTTAPDTTVAAAPDTAATSTTTSPAAPSTDATDTSASAPTSAQVTPGVSGQSPITFDDLTTLQKLGALATAPAVQ